VAKACAPVVKLSSFSSGQCPDQAVSAAGENVRKQTAVHLVVKQNWDSRHAIDLRAHLEPVTEQVPRHNPYAGAPPMIEISAGILALVSVGIFAAHALDAYRAD
jgi:hypothetical protein